MSDILRTHSDICGTCKQPKTWTVTAPASTGFPCPECGWMVIPTAPTQSDSERIARKLWADMHVRAYTHYGAIDKLISAVERAVGPDLAEIAKREYDAGYQAAIDFVASGAK